MVVRWRSPRVAAFMIVAWFVGSIAISFFVTEMVSGMRYGFIVWSIWTLLFAGFTYLVCSLALNRTTVFVESGRLVVHNGPVPSTGNSATDVREIAEISTSSYQATAARGLGGRLYTVFARTNDGKTIPILATTQIDDQSAADELARKVESMIWKSSASS